VLVPEAAQFCHELVSIISQTDALLSARAVHGPKRERLATFRQSAAEVLLMVVGIELPAGSITDATGEGES